MHLQNGIKYAQTGYHYLLSGVMDGLATLEMHSYA